MCVHIYICIHINTHFIRYKYIWLSFLVMWRYCKDSCPAASCIPVTVVSEVSSYIKSLQLFQRLRLCRSYPCPHISTHSRNTIGFLLFFSGVFLKVLELIEREAPKDFCCFVFHTFLGLCNHSHSSRRIQLHVQVCWVAVSSCKAFTVASSNCQCSPECAVILALLPSLKVTITRSLTANLRCVFHLEISSGCGHSTYSKCGRVGAWWKTRNSSLTGVFLLQNLSGSTWNCDKPVTGELCWCSTALCSVSDLHKNKGDGQRAKETLKLGSQKQERGSSGWGSVSSL